MFLKHIYRAHFDSFPPVAGSNLHHKNLYRTEYAHSFMAGSQTNSNNNGKAI